MKTILQRVKKARVKVGDKIIGQIEAGLVVLLGVGEKDSGKEIPKLTQKILNLRIFENEQEKFDKSVLEIKGEILVVPQFTLFADCSKGNRPYFGEAAKPEIAKLLFAKFVEELKKSGLKVETGIFGAKMEVELTNDGPVTINLEA
jgi:D-tyrosyl-tRNA(Tyr) deacylase